MKLIRIIEGDRAVLGILHAEGRIERVAEFDAAAYRSLTDRIVAAFNACDGISVKTLDLMAGGSSSGSIAERVTAWSLFAGRARPSAIRIMEDARKALVKQGEL